MNTDLTEISDEQYLSDLQTFANELGHTPRWQDMEKNGARDPKYYTQRFGSWNAAIEKAGLETNEKGTTQIPTDALIADLQRVTNKLGRKPLWDEYQHHGYFAAHTLKERFGSINAARKEAGINKDGTINAAEDRRDDIDLTPYIDDNETPLDTDSRDALIEELHRLHDHLDKIPSLSNLRNHGRCSHAPFYTEFGDWMSALDAAGFDVSDRADSN